MYGNYIIAIVVIGCQEYFISIFLHTKKTNIILLLVCDVIVFHRTAVILIRILSRLDLNQQFRCFSPFNFVIQCHLDNDLLNIENKHDQKFEPKKELIFCETKGSISYVISISVANITDLEAFCFI